MELGTGYYTDAGEVYFHDPERPLILAYRTKDFVVVRDRQIIRISIYPYHTTNKKALEWIKNSIDYRDKIVTSGGRTLSPDGKIIRNKTEFIYFIYNPDSNAVKIGKAKDVYKRMRSLQTSTPAYLKLLKVIDTKAGKEARETELLLHERFKYLRLLGEWFKFDNELLEFVDKL